MSELSPDEVRRRRLARLGTTTSGGAAGLPSNAAAESPCELFQTVHDLPAT